MVNQAKPVFVNDAEFISATHEADSWLANAIVTLSRQPDLLRTGYHHESMSILGAAVDGLQLLSQFAQSAGKINGLDPLNQAEFVQFGPSILAIITELVSAMESEDSVLLADVIEYELLPVLEHFHQAINTLLA